MLGATAPRERGSLGGRVGRVVHRVCAGSPAMDGGTRAPVEADGEQAERKRDGDRREARGFDGNREAHAHHDERKTARKRSEEVELSWLEDERLGARQK